MDTIDRSQSEHDPESGDPADRADVADGRGRDADSPSDIPAPGWKDVALRVKDEIKNDHLVIVSAGVAFFAFLAIIPALATIASITGLVTSPDTVNERADDLFGALPEQARDLLERQLESLAGSTSGSLSWGVALGTVLSLWSASSGMGNLMKGVNIAYDEDEDERGFVHRKLLALGLTLGAIAFAIFAVGGFAALPWLLDQAGISGPAAVAVRIAHWILLALGLMLALSIVYRYSPDRDDPQWQWVTWGSAIAVVIWIVASFGFQLYVGNFGSYNETYGSLAAVVVLMSWLLISALVVLIGAEINSELEHQTATDSTVGEPQPIGERDAVMADTVGEAEGLG